MGRRKHKHEDHINHEAWAIPYGDLITLLLAFFVVMYAISSVNAGKFRVLSDSLNAAFRGSPTTFEPVQIGERSRGTGADLTLQMMESSVEGKPRSLIETVHIDGSKSRGAGQAPYPGAVSNVSTPRARARSTTDETTSSPSSVGGSPSRPRP
jgi:chemotaxis protein MotB